MVLLALKPMLHEFCGGVCENNDLVSPRTGLQAMQFWDDDVIAGKVKVVTVYDRDGCLWLSDRNSDLPGRYDIDSVDDYCRFLDDFAGVILDYVNFLRDLARDKGRKHLVSMWDAEYDRLSGERRAWVAS